ncbi:hypothetical protein Q4493_01595 [Colwellia sp. 1_MG-2023]|uniref:hypothetical protein n=1 Tax=Colwellia sp. 1_MG-2023 TaxID=3062649 RepID=UPI0026E15B5B|nr:hypothetical protein [Colwellia sp. 1_MG-2023]MDO6444459.1 hypothetical protein [Colwellia sp. 1_MG-2023]
MRKLLSSPLEMPLSESENFIYQNVLKYVPELSLNLMAIKVDKHPEDFLGWCHELLSLSRDSINMDLLEPAQLPSLKKLHDILKTSISRAQIKMTRIAPWPIFCQFIQQQHTDHALDERLALLQYISEIKAQPLSEMIEEDRLAFTGKHTNKHDISAYNFDVEWFASTKSAKVFHQLLIDQPQAFDQALNNIPLEGDVTLTQYNKFVSAYQEIFSSYTSDKANDKKAPLAPATRLLAMRRPDQFIALTASKIETFCQGFSIAKFNNFDFSAYWQDMIGTIRTCAWWHQPSPENTLENEQELFIWKNRVILLDVFLHAEKDSAEKSNYIKLRDKPLKKATKSPAVTRKRSKESAEALIDRALADEALPDYLVNKRDTLIHQVKEGKTVEQAISLMRAIFG